MNTQQGWTKVDMSTPGGHVALQAPPSKPLVNSEMDQSRVRERLSNPTGGWTCPPLSTPTDLRGWLAFLDDHEATLRVDRDVITVHGRTMTDIDRAHTGRYRFALLTAAAGTHPDWWDAVLGRTDVHPDIELPGTYTDPACARCGQSAPHLDDQLLPWCDGHAEVG